MGDAAFYRGKRIVVVGMARTGIEVANFMARAGAAVTISEMKPARMVEADPKELEAGVRFEFGGHRDSTFEKAEFIIPSPGVPRSMEKLVAARERGVPVMSEIEVAAGLIKKPIFAVTGTNGKSTTVSLLSSMFSADNRRMPAVGNIGTPLITMVGREDEYDCLAVEISSFQLEWVFSFHPRSAAILNITEDHLDRYDDIVDYADTKFRIAARMIPEESLILNYDDPILRGRGGSLPNRIIYFSGGTLETGIFCRSRKIMADIGGSERPEFILDVNDLKLVGVHNIENVMAAAAMSLDYGVSPESVRRAALSFESLPHRNEFVAEIGRVRYYDDSKGTNVGAVVKSLESFPGPLILIAGGREKGGSYASLVPVISGKVSLLVLIGEAKERMRRELGGFVKTLDAETMEDAVKIAAENASPGDVVLLSPACSSFDMFKDYHQRGQAYREAVRSMACQEC